MRISCCAYSYRQAFQSGALTLTDFVDVCHDLGMDGMELTAYYFPTTEKAFLMDLKRLAHRKGMAISGTAIGSNFAREDADARQEQIDLTKAWIENSVLLGAPTLRVFAGAVPPGASEEQTFDQVVSCLQQCAAHAWESGITLALENHGGLTQTAVGTLRLMNAVGHPGLKLNLDLGNFEGDVYGQIEACAPFAVATHAKPWATINVAGGVKTRERVDYGRIRRILDQSEYRGFIAIEYEEEEPAETAVPAFAAELRSAFRSER